MEDKKIKIRITISKLKIRKIKIRMNLSNVRPRSQLHRLGAELH
jgi:hypothetical protein